MVAKVIGKDENFMFVNSCPNCAARIQFTRSDARERLHYDYTGDCEKHDTLDCPDCNYNFIASMRRNSNGPI